MKSKHNVSAKIFFIASSYFNLSDHGERAAQSTDASKASRRLTRGIP
jgi:hypothetical protein